MVSENEIFLETLVAECIIRNTYIYVHGVCSKMSLDVYICPWYSKGYWHMFHSFDRILRK